MQQRLIRFDWAMKRLLRNKANFDILEGFLSELLEDDIVILQLLESESNREHKTDKQNRLDLLAENAKKELILIEVQNEDEQDYLLRMLYGTSKIVVENLEIGMSYSKIKKLHSVSIVYFDLGQGEDYLYHGTTNFVGKNKGDLLKLNARQKQIFGDKKVYELYPEYHLIKVNSFDNIAKNTLEEWIYFLKNEEIRPEFKAKGIQKAKKEFDIMDMSEAERKAYKRYLEDLHYAASMHESSFGIGFIEGKAEERKQAEAREKALKEEAEAREKALKEEAEAREKVLKEKAEAEKEAFKLEIARKCLQMGMSIEQVAQMAGLTVEQILKII